jgi:hypothetical protein
VVRRSLLDQQIRQIAPVVRSATVAGRVILQAGARSGALYDAADRLPIRRFAMFRLIKLAMYALVGYVLYELYQGMTQEQGGRSSASSGGSRSRRSRAMSEGSAAGAMTGGGRGRRVEVADATGSEIHRTVGRGVVTE